MGRVAQPCSPGLPPVPMNRFPFPSHSPSLSSLPIQPPNGVRGEQMCASAKKLLPKTKPSSLSPARQAVSVKAKRLSNRATKAHFTCGMTMFCEQRLKEAYGQS